MKMPYSVIIGDRLSQADIKIVKASIEDSFALIDKTANPFNMHSELTLFNNGKLKKPSFLLQQLIDLSHKMATITANSFDPNIGIYNGDKFAFKVDNKKRQYDLCGIAKGFTVDIIGKKLQKLGYKNFLINWGGDILAHGSHPQKNGWVVQIFGRKKLYNLHDEAIASSGHYFTKSTLAKHNFSHIMNSKKGKNVALQSSLMGATCITKDCATADAIATALLASDQPPLLAKKLQKKYGVTIFLVYNY